MVPLRVALRLQRERAVSGPGGAMVTPDDADVQMGLCAEDAVDITRNPASTIMLYLLPTPSQARTRGSCWSPRAAFVRTMVKPKISRRQTAGAEAEQENVLTAQYEGMCGSLSSLLTKRRDLRSCIRKCIPTMPGWNSK